MSTPLFTPFDITPVDPFSDEMEEYVALMNACMFEEWGELAQRDTVDDYRAERASGFEARHYLVRVGERPAAIGKLEFYFDPEDLERPDEVFGLVRVLKSVQGYGIGQAIVRHLEDVSRERKCPRMTAITAARSFRDDRVTRILNRLGYQEQQLELRQDLAGDDIERLPKPPVPVPEGFTSHIQHEGATLEVAEAMATLLGLDAQEYHADLPGPSAEQILEANASAVSSGRRAVQVVVWDADGLPVGFVEGSYREGAPVAEFGANYVRKEYRGQGIENYLAAAASVELTAADDSPSRVRAFHVTDEVEFIEALRRVGFTTTAYYRQWTKDLTATP